MNYTIKINATTKDQFPIKDLTSFTTLILMMEIKNSCYNLH